MTYPPQGGYQQMPQPAPHGYPQPPAPQLSPGGPSRAKGITAVVFAVLAILAALAGAGFAGFDIGRAVADSNPMTKVHPPQMVAAGLLALGAVLLMVGAVMHGKRKKAGWVVLLVGVVVAAGSMALGLVEEEAIDSPAGAVAGVIGLLATGLAVRSRFWLVPKRQPQYQGYPPNVQYGQQPYGPQQGYPQQPPQQW